jgi:hypothetical protein
MAELKIYMLNPEDWEAEYRHVEVVRGGSRTGNLSKLGIETPDNFVFAAHQAGKLIVGNLMHMALVYRQHAEEIDRGDFTHLPKYLSQIKADAENGYDRYWMNNRGYLRVHGREDERFTMVEHGVIEVRPADTDVN